MDRHLLHKRRPGREVSGRINLKAKPTRTGNVIHGLASGTFANLSKDFLRLSIVVVHGVARAKDRGGGNRKQTEDFVVAHLVLLPAEIAIRLEPTVSLQVLSRDSDSWDG